MVFLTGKPRRVLAACCSVEVIKGADGFDWVGFSSRSATIKSDCSSSATIALVCASFFSSRGLPAFFTASRRMVSCLACWLWVLLWISQYSTGVKARISRSRSTTRRVATDCTRPADSPRATFCHSNGDTMKPTTRSKNRLACCALTRS